MNQIQTSIKTFTKTLGFISNKKENNLLCGWMNAQIASHEDTNHTGQVLDSVVMEGTFIVLRFVPNMGERERNQVHDWHPTAHERDVVVLDGGK